jgi:hypothetical protein
MNGKSKKSAKGNNDGVNIQEEFFMTRATAGLNLFQIFRKIVRKSFVSTVFIAVLSDIAGSLISFISSEENDTETVNLTPALYVGIFIGSALLATAESYEKEKFNGPVIEGEESDSDSDSDSDEEEKESGIAKAKDLEKDELKVPNSKKPKKDKRKKEPTLTPRQEFKQDKVTVIKSHLLEGGFLTFSGILVAADDFFTYSAIKSWLKGLIYGQDINSLVAINWYEILVLSALVLSLDLPYEASNEIRAVSKYIKRSTLGKEDNLLIDQILKPFANPFGIRWIRTCGSLLFSLKRAFGFLLNIPPQVIIQLYQKNKLYFGLFAAGGATFLLPMSAFGFIQMYLFEGYSSEKNLRLIMNKNSSVKTGEIKAEKTQWSISAIKILKYGMYTQAPMYGFNAMKSPAILLRYLLKDYPTRTQVLAIAPLTVFQFIFNSLGAQLSEVQEALSKLEKIEKASVSAGLRKSEPASWTENCCFCLFKQPSSQPDGVDKTSLLSQGTESTPPVTGQSGTGLN